MELVESGSSLFILVCLALSFIQISVCCESAREGYLTHILNGYVVVPALNPVAAILLKLNKHPFPCTVTFGLNPR